MQEEDHYRLLDLISRNPEATQREIADELNVSVGKVNYCLGALIDKGHVKVRNFTNNNNKAAYSYLLTPKGIKEKTRITIDFLKRKMEEYEDLQKEIQRLKKEVKNIQNVN